MPAAATTSGIGGPGLRGDARVPGGGQQLGVPIEDLNQPPAFLTILTSMFMHGGWLHIAGNMIFLWIFGNNVEDSMGRASLRRLLPARRVGGRARAGCDHPDATVPLVGASGAIAAVLGGYALLYPRARVLTLFFFFFIFFIEVPALRAARAVDLHAVPAGGGAARHARGRRRGRRGLLGPHRRLPVRPGGDQALRAPAQYPLRTDRSIRSTRG